MRWIVGEVKAILPSGASNAYPFGASTVVEALQQASLIVSRMRDHDDIGKDTNAVIIRLDSADGF